MGGITMQGVIQNLRSKCCCCCSCLVVLLLFSLPVIVITYMDNVTYLLWTSVEEHARDFVDNMPEWAQGTADWVVDVVLGEEERSPDEIYFSQRRDLYESAVDKANEAFKNTLQEGDEIVESHYLRWSIIAAIDSLFVGELEYEMENGEIHIEDPEYCALTLAEHLQTEIVERTTFTDYTKHYRLKSEYRDDENVISSLSNSFNSSYYETEREEWEVSYPTLVDTYRGLYRYMYDIFEGERKTVSTTTISFCDDDECEACEDGDGCSSVYTVPNRLEQDHLHELTNTGHEDQGYEKLRRGIIEYAEVLQKQLPDELPDYMEGLRRVEGGMYSPMGANYTYGDYRPTDLQYFGHDDIVSGLSVAPRARSEVVDVVQEMREENEDVYVGEAFISLEEQLTRDDCDKHPSQYPHQLGTTIAFVGDRDWVENNASDFGFAQIGNHTYRYFPDYDGSISYQQLIEDNYEGEIGDPEDLQEEDLISYYGHKIVHDSDIQYLFNWENNIYMGELLTDDEGDILNIADTGDIAWPVDLCENNAQVVTTGFGYVPAQGRNHAGIDIYDQREYGTPLIAAVDGDVRTWSGPRAGLSLTITDENGVEYRYLHLDSGRGGRGTYSNAALEGQVNRGDVVGYMGNTGASSNPHLHFDIRYPIDLVEENLDITMNHPDARTSNRPGYAFINPTVFLDKPEHVTQNPGDLGRLW